MEKMNPNAAVEISYNDRVRMKDGTVRVVTNEEVDRVLKDLWLVKKNLSVKEKEEKTREADQLLSEMDDPYVRSLMQGVVLKWARIYCFNHQKSLNCAEWEDAASDLFCHFQFLVEKYQDKLTKAYVLSCLSCRFSNFCGENQSLIDSGIRKFNKDKREVISEVLKNPTDPLPEDLRGLRENTLRGILNAEHIFSLNQTEVLPSGEEVSLLDVIPEDREYEDSELREIELSIQEDFSTLSSPIARMIFKGIVLEEEKRTGKGKPAPAENMRRTKVILKNLYDIPEELFDRLYKEGLEELKKTLDL